MVDLGSGNNGSGLWQWAVGCGLQVAVEVVRVLGLLVILQNL